MVLGCAIGFLAALAVVVVSAALVASRRNIVRMIKGLGPTHRGELAARSRRLIGGGLVAAGIAIVGVGLVASNGVAVRRRARDRRQSAS